MYEYTLAVLSHSCNLYFNYLNQSYRDKTTYCSLLDIISLENTLKYFHRNLERSVCASCGSWLKQRLPLFLVILGPSGVYALPVVADSKEGGHYFLYFGPSGAVQTVSSKAPQATIFGIFPLIVVAYVVVAYVVVAYLVVTTVAKLP